MSDHLPECNQRDTVWQKAYYSGVECICPAIRACEQRVRDEDQRILIKHGAEQFVRGERIGKAMGHAAGVQAARDAIEAVPPIDQRIDDNELISLVYDKGEILAAIDALRGES